MSFLATIILVLVFLSPWQTPAQVSQWLGDRSLDWQESGTSQKQLATHSPKAVPTAISAGDFGGQAKSYYAFDLVTATTLTEYNADLRLPIASITKLVSVLVIRHSHSLDEIVTVPALPAYRPEDQILGLQPGQRFQLDELLRAALIPSANDAAETLAIYDAGNTEAFTDRMNSLISEWGITDAHFTSPHGLTETDNYASAKALGKLAGLALSDPFIRQTVSTRLAVIRDLEGRTYQLRSTNQLLEGSRWRGIKTGYTPAAGQSLVGLLDLGGGREVVTVVLNSPDRFTETARLGSFLEHKYEWR